MERGEETKWNMPSETKSVLAVKKGALPGPDHIQLLLDHINLGRVYYLVKWMDHVNHPQPAVIATYEQDGWYYGHYLNEKRAPHHHELEANFVHRKGHFLKSKHAVGIVTYHQGYVPNNAIVMRHKGELKVGIVFLLDDNAYEGNTSVIGWFTEKQVRDHEVNTHMRDVKNIGILVHSENMDTFWKIERLMKENKKLKAELKRLRTMMQFDIDKIQKQCADEIEAARLKYQAEKKAIIQEKDEIIRNKTDEIKKLRKRLEEREKQFADEIKQLNVNFKEKEVAIRDECEQQINNVKDEKMELQNQITTLLAENENLNQNIEDLKRALKTWETDHQAFKQKAETDQNTLLSKNQELEVELANIKSRDLNRKCHLENEESAMAREQLTMDLRDKTARIVTLQREMDMQRDQITNLTQKTMDYEVTITELMSRLENMANVEARLEESTLENQMKDKQIDQLRSEVGRLEKIRQKRDMQYEQTTAAWNRKYQDTVDAMKQRYAALREEITSKSSGDNVVSDCDGEKCKQTIYELHDMMHEQEMRNVKTIQSLRDSIMMMEASNIDSNRKLDTYLANCPHTEGGENSKDQEIKNLQFSLVQLKQQHDSHVKQSVVNNQKLLDQIRDLRSASESLNADLIQTKNQCLQDKMEYTESKAQLDADHNVEQDAKETEKTDLQEDLDNRQAELNDKTAALSNEQAMNESLEESKRNLTTELDSLKKRMDQMSRDFMEAVKQNQLLQDELQLKRHIDLIHPKEEITEEEIL